ncbi:MAG: polysaccharide deacetylase family protein [Leeuwenhoekiella sp.]
MLLVYTTKITPRITYVFKHICTRILQIPVKFTTAVDEFIVHDSLKLSYANKPLGNELHIKSTEVLFEQGITDMEISVKPWEDTKCFFATGTSGALAFDIFAAAFVLLSRYEEFMPHVKDSEGRFPASESLGYQHDFLDQPVVDIWAFKFKKLLKERFSEYKFKDRSFTILPIIDVEQAYELYQIGIMRETGGIIRDLFKLKFKRLLLRLQVNLNLRKDPYDTFSWLINVQKNAAHAFIYFFQVGDYSTFTRNVRYNKRGFRELIKMVGDYAQIGVLFSREALDEGDQMKKEKNRIEGITNKPLNAVRCTSHMGMLIDNYREMIEQEIENDYSMGYPDLLGFRAGTCTPFLYYDLDYESPTPLLIHPICAQSGVFEQHNLQEKELNASLDRFFQMHEYTKQVEGTFVFSFKNKSFTGNGEDEGQWKNFFKELVHE